MFLRGAAGFTLALPFLPSLLRPGSARAGGGPVRKRFVALGVDHGAIRQSNMVPDASKLAPIDYAGQKIRSGSLLDLLKTSGGKAVLSPVLSGDASKLTKTLVGKMNVLRGFDVPFYMAHNRGGHLGDFADNDGNLNGEEGLKHMPTIDQVMAWSSTFYPDAALKSDIKERSLHLGGDRMSWNYADPLHRKGTVQPNGQENDSLSLFNSLFGPPITAQGQIPVADLVLKDYQRLRNGNRRLSAADKVRLDDHIQRIDELQRKLAIDLSSCGKSITTPESSAKVRQNDASYDVDPATQAKSWGLMNDVIVAAFLCDASRIVTMRVGEIFSTYSGDWHQKIAHLAWETDDPGPQQTIADSRQRIFEGVFLDLMAKLDAHPDPDGNGTLLDSTLMQFTQESGPTTHNPIELPVITAGSAGGFLKTGQYCDYRNLDVKATGDAQNSIETFTGLLYHQWLGTVLQAMGLPPSEYESGDYKGYGAVKFATEGWYPTKQDTYNNQVKVMGDILPFLKA